MVKRDEIIDYIHELLNVDEFDDYCVNGLQIEGKSEIQNIIFGVSASQRLFTDALSRKADMIIVHHGLFWKSDPSPFALTGIFRERVALLLKNDINLLGYHLPLDAHPDIGNNAQIMKQLNITPIEPVEVGFLGKLGQPIQFNQFVDLVNQKLETEAQVFSSGTNSVKNILVMSGGSSRYYQLALEKNADTFIGGDIKENIVRELEEVGLNYINAGHYNTEKFGVQELSAKIAQRFKVNCEFIDIPNPV